MLLVLNPEYPQPRKLQKAAELIQQGHLLVYPTDTGYGIGCDPHQKKAVEKLFELTERPLKKPVSILCKDFKQLSTYGHIRSAHFKTLRQIFPGPYTLILEATKELPRHLHGSKKEVGVRVPNHSVVLGILEYLEYPICNATVHNHNKEYIDDPLILEGMWKNHVGAIIDCGLLEENPSTIVDLCQDTPVLLREGQGDPSVFDFES